MVIGARSSSTTGESTTEVQASIHGDHLSQNLQDLLRDGLVVDGDQILRLGVNLESLVESNGSFDLVVAYIKYSELVIITTITITSSFVLPEDLRGRRELPNT